MPNDDRIFALLEEALTSERPLEEICDRHPDLLPALREQVRRCREVEGRLDRMFPPPDDRRPIGRPTQALPVIPGYAVEAVLGRGGTGIVYRARHASLGRSVALKMLLSGEHAGALELTRLLREARAIAALRHPNIVQVYDVGDADGRPFFTMELVEHGTLADRLGGRPMPPREAAALLAALADATNAAHRAGIVHRDLKPANVLMAAGGTPKISDFGLARHFADEPSLLSGGGPVGTPAYMAPEQVRGAAGAAGPSVDVYALGAVLFEALTGRPPFAGGTTAETLRQVLADGPPRPSRLNARVPRDLETVCLKCLGKEPARRYPTAAALAADLRRYLRGEPVEARPAGRAERAWK
ncbi:MAG: pknB 10, partial [Phycisphaerales bacterium]|nr:pknB 10 [Phycisphaerales bacterium]